MRKFFIAALLIFATPALAQQPSASEQALGEKLLQEIQSNVQARAALIEAQRQMAAKDARIKELEAKAPDAK